MSKERITALSPEKLETYRQSQFDTYEQLIERYYKNLKLSESFYTALSLLEVTLRNQIYNAIVKNFNPSADEPFEWLLSEYKKQQLLHDDEHKLLLEAIDRLKRPVYKNGVKTVIKITEGKIIAELTFGFWVHLLSKKYRFSIYTHKPKVFDDIFPYYDSLIGIHPTKHRFEYIKRIYAKLRVILKLRNRISHHEPIFNMKEGLNNIYNDIENILTCMSLDMGDDLEAFCDYKLVAENL